jgi:hypothetical protein
MSKLQDNLRFIGVFNAHILLSRFAEPGKDVACSYSPPEPRACRCATAHVWSPSHKTNPKGHWSDYGKMAFVGYKKESMPKAIAWATERYGVTKWVPDPTNRSTMIPEAAREAAIAAIRNGK